MVHELLSSVLKKFKKNYVPKYLHQWIRLETSFKISLGQLKPSQLVLTVAEYHDERPIITYGKITVWIAHRINTPPYKLVLRMRLTDNVKSIQNHLERLTEFTNMELKACLIEDEDMNVTDKNWNEGKILKSEDTIVSKELYQDRCLIIAKIDTVKVNCWYIRLLLHDFSFSIGRF